MQEYWPGLNLSNLIRNFKKKLPKNVAIKLEGLRPGQYFCMAQKSWPDLYSRLLYKMSQDFFGQQWGKAAILFKNLKV